MKSKFEQYVLVRLYKIVLTLLFIATAVCTWMYLRTDSPKAEALLCGLGTGLFVALIQYVLEWNEHKEIEAIKKLGIYRILPHRDDKTYYDGILKSARKEIFVVGNTASRFLEDFAHENRVGAQTLCEALGRGVRVRILVARREHLPKVDHAKSHTAKMRMESIAKQFPNFQYRFFDHAPAHSLVKVDDECLFGPTFLHAKSKDSPTIHANASSPFVAAYLIYFEDEWNEGVSTY